MNPWVWLRRFGTEVRSVSPSTAVAVIREIRDRIADSNPNPAQIGSIYNFTGRETINGYGDRVGRAYQERAWER